MRWGTAGVWRFPCLIKAPTPALCHCITEASSAPNPSTCLLHISVLIPPISNALSSAFAIAFAFFTSTSLKYLPLGKPFYSSLTYMIIFFWTFLSVDLSINTEKKSYEIDNVTNSSNIILEMWDKNVVHALSFLLLPFWQTVLALEIYHWGKEGER